MPAYRRVAQSDQNVSNRSLEDDAAATTNVNTTTRSRSERIADKLHALVWVVVSYILSVYTKLFHTIMTDERILRNILHAATSLFTINGILIVYLTVYLPFKFPTSNIHKVKASSPQFWEAYCPNFIPIMTVCGILGSFLLVRACYPVWGFLTPLILGVVALGAFFSLHFIPWF